MEDPFDAFGPFGAACRTGFHPFSEQWGRERKPETDRWRKPWGFVGSRGVGWRTGPQKARAGNQIACFKHARPRSQTLPPRPRRRTRGSPQHCRGDEGRYRLTAGLRRPRCSSAMTSSSWITVESTWLPPFDRRLRKRGRACATCRNTRLTSIRSSCLTANSRRSSARSRRERSRRSRAQFARSSHNSALTNAPTVSHMQATLQYDRNPL